MPPGDRSVADRGEVRKTLLGLGTALPRLPPVPCASASSLHLPLLSVLCVSLLLPLPPLSVLCVSPIWGLSPLSILCVSPVWGLSPSSVMCVSPVSGLSPF